MGRIRLINKKSCCFIPVCFLRYIPVCCCNTISFLIKSIMVPTTRSQIRSDNTNHNPTPISVPVNNNPITTQDIIMVQTEAEHLQ
jgi:hypothetical protein